MVQRMRSRRQIRELFQLAVPEDGPQGLDPATSPELTPPAGAWNLATEELEQAWKRLNLRIASGTAPGRQEAVLMPLTPGVAPGRLTVEHAGEETAEGAESCWQLVLPKAPDLQACAQVRVEMFDVTGDLCWQGLTTSVFGGNAVQIQCPRRFLLLDRNKIIIYGMIDNFWRLVAEYLLRPEFS